MGALTVGAAVHGYAGGAFGRDSYACRVVVAVGPDWVVTRNVHGEAEAVAGEHVEWVAEHAEERDWCDEDCQPETPPEPEPHDPSCGGGIAENPDGYRYCAWCGWEPPAPIAGH